MELLRLLAFSIFVIVVFMGLLYFIDALHVFTDEESSACEEEGGADSKRGDIGCFQFDLADKLTDVIGTYGETPIHRYAQIGGVSYEFAHVYCHACKMVVQADARCLAPGFVYLPVHLAVTSSE